MTKTLLRSGNLDDYQSVGGGGQAVFTSALQIRETLRLQKHDALVACLAVPQVNDDGDRVDWYAPRAGKVVAWKAADEAVQARALAQLTSLFEAAAQLSASCQQSTKTARRLFGALLEKALQFPGPNHVFLVDNSPVIAFWGFVNLNEQARGAPFACLQPPARVPDPAPALPPAGLAAAYSETMDAAAEEATPISPPPQAEPEPAAAAATPPADTPAPARSRIRPGRLAFLGLPLVAGAAALLLVPDLLSAHRAESAAVVQALPAVPAQPMLTGALPLRPATVIAPVKEPPKAETQTVVLTAVPGDALVMEAGQVRAGTTGFLNGSWRVVLDAKDAVTGKAPLLRYQIKNNKGTARLVHGDSVVCKADVFAGLHQNGELQIKNRGLARCSDGSRYPLPLIVCTAGTSGVAQCSGRYDASTVIPLTFHKIGR